MVGSIKGRALAADNKPDEGCREVTVNNRPSSERSVPNQSRRDARARALAARVFRAGVLVAILALSSPPARPQQNSTDLAQKSLEDLMSIEVTSVSKTKETLSSTAAAVFVISPEDVSRSGATNIPDLLRMVPGMNVSQINGNTWALSARGFNERFSNELLVLVDGRPVYTQTFGGVFWDTLDLPLEDIERIEVIRGPGGSIWDRTPSMASSISLQRRLLKLAAAWSLPAAGILTKDLERPNTAAPRATKPTIAFTRNI